MTPTPSLRPPWPYVALVAALFAVAWIVAASVGRHTISDSADYLHQAEHLAAGRFWYAGAADAPEDARLYSRRPPGYAAVLVALRTVSADARWIALVQSLLGVATWVLLWRVLMRAGGPPHGAPLVLGLALAPAILIYAQFVMSDVLFAFVLVAAVERYVAFVRGGPLRDLALYNGLLALALLVKPVVLYLWLFNVPLTAYALWHRGARGGRLWPTALALLLPLTALGLGLAHRAQTGVFEVSSIQTENLLHQNAGRLLTRLGDDETMAAIDARADALPTYPERARYQAAEARRILLAHPLAYAGLHLQGVVHFFLDPGRFDLQVFLDQPSAGSGLMARYSAEGWRGVLRGLVGLPPLQTAVLALLFVWNAAVLAAFGWWLLRADVPLPIRLALFVLVGYVALVTGPVGAARYRLAIYPLMLLAVPFVWARMREHLRRPASANPVVA